MGTAYDELFGQTIERWTPEGFAAQRTLRCPWSARNTLSLELLRYGGSIYPGWPYNNVRAVSISSIKGVGADAASTAVSSNQSIQNYDVALLVVNYETVFFEPYSPGSGVQESPGIRVEETLELGSEFLTVGNGPAADGSVMVWSDVIDEYASALTGYTYLEEDEAPSKRFAYHQYVITRFSVPNEPPDELYDYPGFINSSAVNMVKGSKSFEPGTLFFNGASPKTVDGPDGETTWTITYRFTYKPNGWNRIWDKSTATYKHLFRKNKYGNVQLDPITLIPIAYPLYTSADLNLVFARP